MTGSVGEIQQCGFDSISSLFLSLVPFFFLFPYFFLPFLSSSHSDSRMEEAM